MKCAMEILQMKEQAVQDYILEQKRLDEECNIKHLQIIQDTINFCNTFVQQQLENCALERKPIEVNLLCDKTSDRLKHNLFYRLCFDGLYADGTPYYAKDTAVYDLDVFQQYLYDHCFRTYVTETSYKMYGLGKLSGIKIIVKI